MGNLAYGTTPSRMPLRITPRLMQRFWSKVDDLGDCWGWAGANRGGYGCLKINRVLIDVHVFSWRLANGGIAVPDGRVVMHSCDVRDCVNPSHLSLGTKQDNYDDMIAKGRRIFARGERCPHAILSEALVREIRRLYVPGKFGSVKIARRLGVTKKSVDNVLFFGGWSHVQ